MCIRDRNVTWEATGTVAVVGRDGQSGLLAESHATVSAEDTLIPAYSMLEGSSNGSIEMLTLDDLTDTNAGLEVATTDGRVEPVIIERLHHQLAYRLHTACPSCWRLIRQRSNQCTPW